VNLRSVLLAIGAMTFVGASVAAASLLGDYPVLASQGVRYAVASLLLVAWMRASKRSLVRPSRADLTWVGGVALVGMVLFNIFLIASTNRIDPSLVGAIVGTAPVGLAVIGALQLGRRPRANLVAAAITVAIGTALVLQARVEDDPLGIALALGAMLGEVGFSLLAVPVLASIGPLGVSIHSTWMAAVMLIIGALVFDGSLALPMPTPTEFLALTYLTVFVTAIAFMMWYTAVDGMGAERAGLFAGIIPVSALLTSSMIGTDIVTLPKLVGVLIVGLGVAFGLRNPGGPSSQSG